MISAWSSRQRLVLGQNKVADKSNEITAIPDLLDLLTLKGATVTIDAMGCQTQIAAKIIAKEADYVLALKGNQGRLRNDVQLFFEAHKASPFKDICGEPASDVGEKSRPHRDPRLHRAGSD